MRNLWLGIILLMAGCGGGNPRESRLGDGSHAVVTGDEADRDWTIAMHYDGIKGMEGSRVVHEGEKVMVVADHERPDDDSAWTRSVLVRFEGGPHDDHLALVTRANLRAAP